MRKPIAVKQNISERTHVIIEIDNTIVLFYFFTVDVYSIILKEHKFDSDFTKLSNHTSSSLL